MSRVQGVSGNCAVFYSVLRENARCFILCDTLWSLDPYGEKDIILLSPFKIVFLYDSHIIFVCPIGVQTPGCVRHLRGGIFCDRGKCAVFYSVLRENARCFILCDTLWTQDTY